MAKSLHVFFFFFFSSDLQQLLDLNNFFVKIKPIHSEQIEICQHKACELMKDMPLSFCSVTKQNFGANVKVSLFLVYAVHDTPVCPRCEWKHDVNKELWYSQV